MIAHPLPSPSCTDKSCLFAPFHDCGIADALKAGAVLTPAAAQPRAAVTVVLELKANDQYEVKPAHYQDIAKVLKAARGIRISSVA